MPAYPRPASNEHAEHFAGYIGQVPDGDLVQTLERHGKEFAEFLGAIPKSKHDFAYGPGKWTVKEMIGHISDTERVFAYRAMRIGRGDTTPLPGFDENAWVPMSGARDRTLADLIAECQAVRAASVVLFQHLSPEAIARRGTASNREITVRAIAWIVAGHAMHHQKILRERYLAA
jgi:DinB family protein